MRSKIDKIEITVEVMKKNWMKVCRGDIVCGTVYEMENFSNWNANKIYTTYVFTN